MSPEQIAVLVVCGLLWLGLIYVLVIEPIRWWLQTRTAGRNLTAPPLYKVDHCGMCHGSGKHPAREGYRSHGDPCSVCRGRGKVVRHPGSSSCAGPAPVGAEVGSFVGGPAW